jgi:hypothetical protein
MGNCSFESSTQIIRNGEEETILDSVDHREPIQKNDSKNNLYPCLNRSFNTNTDKSFIDSKSSLINHEREKSYIENLDQFNIRRSQSKLEEYGVDYSIEMGNKDIEIEDSINKYQPK